MKDIEQKIYRVLTERNPIVSYVNNLSFEDNCYAFFFDGKETENGPLNTTDISISIGTYSIIGLGNIKNGTFMNRSQACYVKQALQDASTKPIPQAIGRVIGFDSNLFSSIRTVLTNPAKDPDCYKLLMYIKHIGIPVEPNHYVYEDIYRKSGMKEAAPVYRALASYYAYERMSENELKGLDKANCKLTDNDWDKALHLYNAMEEIHTSPEVWGEFGVGPIYCMLLETDILKWDPVYKDRNKAFEELFKFVVEDLHIYLEDVLYSCVRYLNNSQDKDIQKFFGKMNIRSKKLLQGIESMAWDFWHMKSIPLLMADYYRHTKIPSFYYLATRDKGLVNTISYNPIMRIVFYDDRPYYKYKHTVDEVDFLPDYLKDAIPQTAAYRAAHVKEVDYRKIAEKKEKELLSLI